MRSACPPQPVVLGDVPGPGILDLPRPLRDYEADW